MRGKPLFRHNEGQTVSPSPRTPKAPQEPAPALRLVDPQTGGARLESAIQGVPRDERGRAVFASLPEATRGRFIDTGESVTRSPYQRDRDRILHATSFRRLKHKTQVFVYHEGDHFRTRMTHSLEVAQIARSIARVLSLNEDLAEAVALAHDLGHPPFGHAGETALHDCMARFDGFDHNAQTLRVLTKLEQRYADFDGLNLTYETLEGVVKHNGPLLQAPDDPGEDLPAVLREFAAEHDLGLHSFAGPEAQVAALADDIAYNNHDIDDGLRAGLFTLEQILEVPLVGGIFKELMARYPGIDQGRLINEAIRRLMTTMVDDLILETCARIARLKPRSLEDVRGLGEPLVGFSAEMTSYDRAIRAFLWPHMYRHYRVVRMTTKAKRLVREMFDLCLEEPRVLPPDWQARCPKSPDGRPEPGAAKTARVICDYIAGMTDNFAIEEYRKLFGPEVRSL